MTYQQDQLTRTIIECIIKVHKILGPGFLESIYRKLVNFSKERADFRRIEAYA